MDLVPVLLAGRESRIDEPPLTDLHLAARTIAEQLETGLDRPWALVGHSLGALLAFELARELRRRGARSPEALVVSAHRAPHVVDDDKPLHRLPDEPFLEAVGDRFGGIPTAVRESAELLELLLPALRADIEMVETYQYKDEPPLETEILALGGADDRTVSAAGLAAWERHTAERFSVRWLPGGHFFLFQGKAETAALQLITTKLAQAQRGCI